MVTYHFPPSSASGAFRLLGFARHLPKYDWRAAVVSAPTIPWEPVDHALSALIPPETALYPVPYTKSRVVRRFAQYSGWVPPALVACERAIREQKPEALLTSGPPHHVHWLGLWLKRRHGLPWVADFRDPWFPTGTVDPRMTFASRWVRAQETAVFSTADLVIANTPGACRALAEDHPQFQSKFMSLTNGYDPELFESAPRAVSGPPRIVHTGAIYWGRDPRPFFNAVKSLTEAGTALLVDLYGPPPESHLDLAQEIKGRGLDHCVTNRGQVPYAQCVRAWWEPISSCCSMHVIEPWAFPRNSTNTLARVGRFSRSPNVAAMSNGCWNEAGYRTGSFRRVIRSRSPRRSLS